MKEDAPLFGHQEAERYWLSQLESGKLAHGWIISGPKGVGKAILAFRFARHLFSSPHRGEAGRGASTEQSQTSYRESPHPSPPPAGEGIAHRIATGAHADFLRVEPAFDDKKGEPGRVITVDQAREVSEFLSLKPAEGAWRVVIIDSSDALNTAAANAILKILEEPPPQAVLLLISHNPGRLLPTIRSRAAMLKLKPLASEDFNEAMRLLYPDMDYQRRAALYALSGGSPGLAMEYEEERAIEIYGDMLDILCALPSPDTAKIHAFAEHVNGAQGHAPFKTFTRLALVLLKRLAKTASGASLPPIMANEKEILLKLAALHPPGIWAVKWQQAEEQFALTEARHLDYRQAAILFFHSIASREGFVLSSAA